MRVKWEGAATAALVVCALITTTLVIRQAFFGRSTAATPKPVYIANWKAHLEKGVLLGSAAAPVQLIEFADFECPYCANFHRTLKALRERYPTQVALTYVHFPLVGHRFALPAARAAECAREQDRFEPMYDGLFAAQDSFGLRQWSDFAADAGIPDVAKFDACIKSTNPLPRIEQGRQLGDQLEVKATPTVIVNGWKLAVPPSAQELDAMVKGILAGRSPVSGEEAS